MKLIFLQDLDFVSVTGGAELTDRAHFTYGVRKGHDINLVTPSIHDQEAIFQPADGVIVSNATQFRPEVFQRFIDMGRPYIFFLHDYANICKYRLFFPMAERCRSCYLKERWLPIYQKARLIIWLSPLHRSSWLWMCPELEGVPYALVPSPVDPKEFYDMGLPRDGVLCVNELLPFKGRENSLKWIEGHPNERITLVGVGEDGGLPANCASVGPVSYHRMNELYNRHRALLHLPQSPQPFNRTVAEGYLAGCQIIGNSLIGALSWPFFSRGREAVAQVLADSSKSFWEAVEGVL